jgi:5'(3')-deoxyribonucleotidase
VRIGVDLDGVCYDFVGALRKWIHESTGRPLATMPDAECWDFFKYQWNMPTAEFLRLFDAGVAAGRIFRFGPPLPGAVAGVQALQDAGHEIHIVTNRPQPGARENTLRWLAQHRIPFDSLTFSADKTCVPTDVFIDDNIENYEALRAAGVSAVFYDQAWNRSHDGVRVHSWDAFVALCEAPVAA